MLKLNLTDLDKLLAALSREGRVYAPFRRGGRTDFAWYAADGSAGEPDLENYTVKAPKDVLFPQVETLLKFHQEGRRLDLQAAPLPQDKGIAFGVRACDIRGFEVLDKVFLQDPQDEYYKARRDSLTIIGLGCSEPEETCFCRTFGIDPAHPGADVDTWAADGCLYWDARTEKGKALTDALGGSVPFTDAGEEPAAVAQQAAALQERWAQLPLNGLHFDERLAAQELPAFHSPVWEKLAPTCLGCCTCTYVCPTCHCFDVRDEKTGPFDTERYRCWDSCMDRDFTQMPHGNPRKGRLERFRQRYMHKLVYFPEDHEGTFACVGCGRCLKACPVNLNIVKVERALTAAMADTAKEGSK